MSEKFVNEKISITKENFEKLLLKEERTKRINRDKMINVVTSRCKSCKTFLSESTLNNYHYEELSSSSVKVITCPYCGVKQAIAYIPDKYWYDYEMTL